MKDLPSLSDCHPYRYHKIACGVETNRWWWWWQNDSGSMFQWWFTGRSRNDCQKKVAIIFQSEQKIELKKSSKLVNIQSIFTEHSVMMMGEKWTRENDDLGMEKKNWNKRRGANWLKNKGSSLLSLTVQACLDDALWMLCPTFLSLIKYPRFIDASLNLTEPVFRAHNAA